jgi:hypothetical protein
MLLATDGGLYKLATDGQSWQDIDNIPNTQFYHVAYNPFQPANYYGGAQDNGTCSGNASDINAWYRIYGGDGFKPMFDPVDPMITYAETQNGGLAYSNDGGSWFNDMTNGIDFNDRINWDMPYIMSKSDPTVLYCGTQYVYKMTGAPYGFWQPISPDLTDGDIYGARFHNMSCLEESPVNTNTLYAGTSDGNVWVSLDAGSTWSNVTGTLPDRYVTSIKASPNTSNVAYVTVSGYKDNDNIPHIHKTTNNGQSWTSISGDLPQLAINDVMPVSGDDNVLFVATDGGVYGTINGGVNWTRVGSNMPVIPVYDLELNESQQRIIAGTFGRSIMSFPLDSIPLPVGIKDMNKQSNALNLYPNPCHDRVTISSDEVVSSIEIYDLNGKKVYSFTEAKKVVEVNTDRLPVGTYISKVVMESGRVEVRRFVKI